MDEDTLNDLKQFITATVSQATADLVTKDDLQELNRALSTKINDLDLKIDAISEALHENLNEHDLRLTKLEQQAA